MKHCLTGALWILIALGLPIKLSALLMFFLIIAAIGIHWKDNWNTKYEF